MTLYRALRNLSRNERIIPGGTLTELHWLKPEQIDKLIEVGAVAEVATPPLVALPGWKTRAGKFGALNISTAGEFLEADTAFMADTLHLKPETVERWKAEVKGWLTVPATDRG